MLHQKIKGFDKLVTGGNGWRPFSPNGRDWGQVYGQGNMLLRAVDDAVSSPERPGVLVFDVCMYVCMSVGR